MTAAEELLAKVAELLETMFWIYAGYFAVTALICLVVLWAAIHREAHRCTPPTREELADYDRAYEEWLNRSSRFR